MYTCSRTNDLQHIMANKLKVLHTTHQHFLGRVFNRFTLFDQVHQARLVLFQFEDIPNLVERIFCVLTSDGTGWHIDRQELKLNNENDT